MAAVRRQASGLVVVEALETWQPRPGLRVDLAEVEDAAATLAERFKALVVVDPWQSALMGQRLRARGVRVEEFQFTPSGRQRLFSVLLDLVRTGRLRCRPHEALRRELLGLEVQETTAGWRVDHRPGRHDDHVVAVALAAQAVAGVQAIAPPEGRSFWEVNVESRDRGLVVEGLEKEGPVLPSAINRRLRL